MNQARTVLAKKKMGSTKKSGGEEGGKERGGFNQQIVAYLIDYTKKKKFRFLLKGTRTIMIF